MNFLKRLFGGRPDAAAYHKRGLAKQSKRDLDGAIADYTKAIGLKPDYPADVYDNRGMAKAGKGDFDGALADFNKAIEIEPDLYLAYRGRATIKDRIGDLDGAIADLTKVIELKPAFTRAYVLRGRIKETKGDLDGAIADYTKAIGPAPQLQCPTCGTNYRLGDDATMVTHEEMDNDALRSGVDIIRMVTSQDMANIVQRGGATMIGRDIAIAGEAWAPSATQTRPALIGRKRNRDHPTQAEVLEDVTDLLENVSRIRETIEKGSKAFWWCEKCAKNKQPHEFPSDF